jgi:MOSC domain-containing protein YiiM
VIVAVGSKAGQRGSQTEASVGHARTLDATTWMAAEREPTVPSVLSVNVGMPQPVAWRGKTVFTGVWKHPVEGPRMVRRLNIDGDGQGDTTGHGGEQRAVLVYQIQSYGYWQRHFGRDDFTYGQFGENLTVDGLANDQVCIGDRYRIGEAEFEVTQPRVTCYRVGLRLGEPELPALLVSHRRPGSYMRVIREGHIQAGDHIIKTRTGPGALSVADIDALLYLPGRDPDQLRLALQIPALSPGWQQSFRELVAHGDSASAAAEPSAPIEPAWGGFRSLRVTKVVPETTTVSSIYLAAPDGSPLPSAEAGQYLTLRIAGAGAGFMADVQDALRAVGLDPSCIHTELFGASRRSTPVSLAAPTAHRTRRTGRGVPDHWSPSPAAASTRPSTPTGPACSSSPTPATSAPTGVAGPVSATPAPRPCSRARSRTSRCRWSPQPRARCSSAAPGPTPTSSWTCGDAG